MSRLQIALEKLEQKALDKIKRKIVAYNKKQGQTKWFDIALPLKDEVCFNVEIGSAKTFIETVEILADEIIFRTEGGYIYDHLTIEQIVEIADSL